MDGSFDGDGRRWVLYGLIVLFVAGAMAVAWAGVQRVRAAGEPVVGTPYVHPAPVPSPVASAVPVETATSTPAPRPSPSVTETVSESGGPAVTVLFGGGPASGPWQQLGTVAEITHPSAPSTARFSYLNGWSDPEGENQPPELWDEIVVEVAAQVVELGDPVDRPAFGGAPGSEPFNSFGGMQDIYFDDGLFTAYWSATFVDDEGVARANYLYLIDFNGRIENRTGPIVYREDGVRSFQDNAVDLVEAMRNWASEQGVTDCERC